MVNDGLFKQGEDAESIIRLSLGLLLLIRHPLLLLHFPHSQFLIIDIIANLHVLLNLNRSKIGYVNVGIEPPSHLIEIRQRGRHANHLDTALPVLEPVRVYEACVRLFFFFLHLLLDFLHEIQFCEEHFEESC